MRIPLSWLNDLFTAPLADVEAIRRALTDAGLEVDGIERVAPGFERVVTGRIVSADPHPNADALRVCRTDLGGEFVQIVTGATNVQAGDIVPVAREGAVLPGGKEIKAAKLRGVESFGMYCSRSELALPGGVDGVEVLPPDTPLGRPAAEVMGVGEVVLEIAVLANRPDALSLVGVARELAAAGLGTLKAPELAQLPTEGAARVQVSLEAPELCPRYAGLVVEGLTVGPSPEWLSARLEAAGVRSISNVVDVTNYVMLELGQPLHAFDLAQIQPMTLAPRRARAGETMLTLDGVERTLTSEMLVIADAQGPQAIAGVMGGAHSQVHEGTSAILLESAYFDPAATRRTGRTLGLSSESSYRFERGVDPEGTMRALARAAHLLAALAGGRVEAPVCDARVSPDYPAPMTVTMRPARLARVLGAELPLATARQRLETIGLAVQGEDPWQVTVPGWRRHDVTREIDVIEEVARLLGYDAIPASFMPAVAPVALAPAEALRRRVRDVLEGLGLAEVVTTSLVDGALLERARAPREGAIALANPLADMELLRTSMLPGLLEVARRNHAHGERDVALYEVGKTYLAGPTGRHEGSWVAFLVMGDQAHGVWQRAPEPLVADFFWAKGIVERLLAALGLGGWRAQATDCDPALHPGRAALLADALGPLGVVGEIHPAVYQDFDLPEGGRAAVGYLDLDALLARIPAGARPFTAFGRYPAVLRDLAVVVPSDLPVAEVLELVREAAGELLEELGVFDRYQGPQIPEDRVSLGLRLKFRMGDRTLTEADVEPVHARIVALLAERFGGMVRDR